MNLTNDARFANNGDGTITDTTTGLMWSAEDVTSERVDWAAAGDACHQLTLGGHTDWRLPSRAELISLVDDTRHNPSINVAAFPTCRPGCYWTGTECAWTQASAWFVGFHAGSAGSCSRTPRTGERSFVRAVRSLPPDQSICLNQSDPYATLRAASNAGARIQAWHLNGITREDATAIAADAAFKHGRQHSYVTEPFQPHEWVIEAILAAANGITSNDGRWDTLSPPEGRGPEFACAPHLYQVHPDDEAKALAGSQQPITVWQINDIEWFAGGGTPESILAWYMDEYGVSREDATGYDEVLPRALDAEELDGLKFVDCDENERPTGVIRTFREQLAIEVAQGGSFPRLFASTEG